MQRWSIEKAKQWYSNQPYLFGANFIPSTAINQLEMWQAETFDPSTIDKELSFANGIGMNTVRVYLHDLLWDTQKDEFISRINTFLDIANRWQIKTIFVLFDDCWSPEFSLGPQPAPTPYTHNSGWIQSPGQNVVTQPDQWARLKKYTIELLETFGQDPRVLMWDLYNEPGNGACGDDDAIAGSIQGRRSLPFLQAVFRWARAANNVSQPLTAALWSHTEAFAELNQFQLEASDIITFHNYQVPQELSECISKLQTHGRPLLCTEYLARGRGNNFEHCLTLMHKRNVGAINWGLVSGKTQTIYPWSWSVDKGEPDTLFHDVFYPDGSLLYPHEAEIFKSLWS